MFFKKKKSAFDGDRKIVVGEGTSRRVVEGYNRLKDNILYMSADGSKKVIQFESANPAEGKTSVACNLAVSLGQNDKKVVVVDLDFRKPRAHILFGLSKNIGISEYMLGSVTKEQIIKHTEYKNVDMVTGGEKVHNSSLVLTSEVFKELIESLKAEYDFVILDCAPVLGISDYIHISKVSDGVLFVVAYAKTTKGQVVDAIKELKRNDVTILGSVFSMYDRKKDSKSGYNNYYYSASEADPEEIVGQE